MPRLFTLLTAALLILAVLPAAAHAQDTSQQPDTTQRDPALPDIAPREFEIRGQLEISLPTLTRQPLTGFEAEPPVPPLPPNLEPLIEPDALPRYTATQELPEQDQPPRLAVPPAPLTGEVEAGGGRYFSRFGRGLVSLPLSDRETVGLRFNYVGLDGHVPFEGADFRTPANTFDGYARFRTERDPVALSFTLDGFYDDYTLFGATTSAASDFEAQPDRTGQNLKGTLALEARRLPARLSASYGETRYETTAASETPAGPFLRIERRFDADGSLEVPLGDLRGLADARTSVAGLDTDGGLRSDVALVSAAAGARTNLQTSLDLSAALRVLHFNADRDVSGGPTASATYFSPDVRLDAAFIGGVTGYLQNRPGADFNGLADLYAESPYLLDEPAMQPTIRTVDAEGGLRLHRGPVELGVRGGYVYAPSYRYFASTATTAYSRGLVAARYGSARIIRGGADASFEAESGFGAALGVEARGGQLTDGDESAIPYFAPITGRALLSYALPNERGLVQVTGTFESARYVSRAEDEQVGAFLDVDAKAEYALTPALGLVLRVENVSVGALERWERYPLSPFVISTGLRVQL